MSDLVLAARKYRNNGELVAACAQLGYLRQTDHVLDPTYGNGVWWRSWHPARPPAGEASGKLTTISGLDFRQLPFADAVFDAAAYDPPYVCVGGRSTSGIKDFLARFGMDTAPRTPTELQQLMNDGLTEMARVVKPRSTILMKCADYVWSGKLWLGTHYTLTHALNVGLTVRDRLEMVGNVRAQPGDRTHKCRTCAGSGHFDAAANGGEEPVCTVCNGSGRLPTVQQHARRNLSTLFVFTTPGRTAR
jgi:hypothetical protein